MKNIGTNLALALAATSLTAPAVAQSTNDVCRTRTAIVENTSPVSYDFAPYAAWYTGTERDQTGDFALFAWKPGANGKPVIDNTYSEIARRNDSQNMANRIQDFNGTYVATKAIDLHNGSTTITAKIESFTAAGAIATQQCDIDTNTDTKVPGTCKPAQPFITIPVAIGYMNHINEGGAAYIKLLGMCGKIANGDYDATKARAFFAKKAANTPQPQ